MKKAYLLKVLNITVLIMLIVLETSCQTTKEPVISEKPTISEEPLEQVELSEQELTKLEEFMTVFTNPSMEKPYPLHPGIPLIDIVTMRLASLEDERITINVNYDYNVRYSDTGFHKDAYRYEIPLDVVYDEIYKYFGIEKEEIINERTQRPKEAVIHDGACYTNSAASSWEIGYYAKIERVFKNGDELTLFGYTVDEKGNRYIRPTPIIRSPGDERVGGVLPHGIYEFQAVVAPHEYNGEKTWKLVEFIPTY